MAEATFKYKVVVDVQGSALKSLDAQLKKLTSSILQISNLTKTVGKNLDNMSIGGKNSVQKLVDSVKNLGAALLVVKGIELTMDFGKKVIEAAKFRQTAVLGLEQGYKGRGETIFQDLISIANKTPADTKPLLEFANTLAPALKDNEETLKKLVLLRADLEAKGAPISALENLSSALLQTLGGSKPEVGGNAIALLGGKDKYNQFLGKELGIVEDNPALLAKKIEKQKNLGKITAQAYTNAYVKFANDYLGQANIGDTSIKMATGSVAGALSNFSSVLDNMLFSIKLEDMAGIQSFIKVLTQITNILTSKAFQSGLAEIINDLFSGFNNLANNPERILLAMRGFLAIVKEIAHVLGSVFEFITKIATARSLDEALMDIVVSLKDVLVYVGKLIGEGIRIAFFGDDTPNPKAKPGAAPPKLDFNTPGQKFGQKLLDDAKPSLPADMAWMNKIDWNNTKPAPTVINHHVEVHGNANPDEVKKASTEGLMTAIEKARMMNQLRKGGKSK